MPAVSNAIPLGFVNPWATNWALHPFERTGAGYEAFKLQFAAAATGREARKRRKFCMLFRICILSNG